MTMKRFVLRFFLGIGLLAFHASPGTGINLIEMKYLNVGGIEFESSVVFTLIENSYTSKCFQHFHWRAVENEYSDLII